MKSLSFILYIYYIFILLLGFGSGKRFGTFLIRIHIVVHMVVGPLCRTRLLWCSAPPWTCCWWASRCTSPSSCGPTWSASSPASSPPSSGMNGLVDPYPDSNQAVLAICGSWSASSFFHFHGKKCIQYVWKKFTLFYTGTSFVKDETPLKIKKNLLKVGKTWRREYKNSNL